MINSYRLILKILIRSGVMIFTLSVSVFAQGTVNERGVYHPTEEEIARNKRIAEMLRHPTFFSLRLVSSPRDVPRERSTDTPAPYKVKDYIGFELFISQNSSEAFTLSNYLSPYYEYRPELMRDGEVIAYKKQAQQSVNYANDHPPSGSMIAVRLTPGVEHQWGGVQIDDWYEPLTTGRYQLTVKKRFTWDGDWVISNPVYFEVIPRRPGSPIPPRVSIELSPQGVPPRTDAKPYQLGSEVVVTFLVVNKSDQPLKINVIDREYGNQPLLFKNGTLVPYLEEATALIKSKEENPRLVSVVDDFFLDPQVGTWPDGLDLKKWYGPLSPGSYRLVIRHRFEIDGPWSDESEPLLFEIPALKRN